MKIQILMSTYNGEKYLRAQLDSIAEQILPENTQMALLIRDDGSSDQTTEIIKEYQAIYPWISCYIGENVGVQRSFFDLINSSDSDVDYVAFADQDDVWLPEKLSRALNCLEQMKKQFSKAIPLLYCSAQKLINANSQPLYSTVKCVVKKISFGNALVQNICTGCTMVANGFLIKTIKDLFPEHIEHIIMHDWWFYLTASCFGKVYYDNKAYIEYRQHDNNTQGLILTRTSLLKYRLSKVVYSDGKIWRQIKAFRQTYFPLLTVPGYHLELETLECLLISEHSFYRRLRLICNHRYFRQKFLDDIVFRGILLIGKL